MSRLNAIEVEKQSLNENEVWTITDEKDIPESKMILTSKLVLKQNEDGSIESQTFSNRGQQKERDNYFEIFSTVVNNGCLKLLSAITESKNYNFMTFD